MMKHNVLLYGIIYCDVAAGPRCRCRGPCRPARCTGRGRGRGRGPWPASCTPPPTTTPPCRTTPWRVGHHNHHHYHLLDVPYSASPVLYEPPLSGPGVSGGGGGGGDPLLDNSNLCDILMLERALGGCQTWELCLLCLTRPILFRF